MRSHFKIFYASYIRREENPPPNARENLTLDDIKSEEVTHDLMGSFAGYLVNAKCLSGGKNKAGKKLLKYQTAMGLFSALKTFLKNKFIHERQSIKFLEDSHCKLITTKLKEGKVSQSIASDEPLFGKYDTAKTGDKKAITALAFWKDCVENTEFAYLFNSCVTNCGRGSEVS